MGIIVTGIQVDCRLQSTTGCRGFEDALGAGLRPRRRRCEVDRRVEEWQPTADERRFDDLSGVVNRINDDEHSFLVQSYESRLA